MQSLLEKVQDLMSVSCGAGSVPDSIVGRKVSRRPDGLLVYLYCKHRVDA